MQFATKIESGPGNFLKLTDGDSVRGVFRGNPSEFKQHWVDNKSIHCGSTENSPCELCKKGDRPNFRFRINFIMNENGVFSSKIFEQGAKVYRALQALHQDYNLEKTTVKITRSGTGTKTSYSILPTPNGNLSPDLETKISQVPLKDLIFPSKEMTGGNTKSDAAEDDGVPF